MLENVLLPLRFSQQRKSRVENPEKEAQELLARLGLKDPDMLERRITELSVGQQQRVAVARAMIGSPEILIADEPTSALDHDQRENFLSLLFDASKERDMTVVFVSHDASLVPLFDDTFTLELGGLAGVT